MVRKKKTGRPVAISTSFLRKKVNFSPEGMECKLTVTPGGFGFAVPTTERNCNDIFIPEQFLNGAIDGDLVSVCYLPDNMMSREQLRKGRAGRISKILERGRELLVAELLPGKRLLPFSKRIPHTIQLIGTTGDAHVGDWVTVRIRSSETHPDALLAEFVNRIGQSGCISADLDAVVAAYDIPPPYTAEEEAKAALLEPDACIPRRDCSNLFCVTIDPFDAKDHDDAMTLEQGKKRGTWILGVHIADVAAYISQNSVWDKMAKARCFTSYLPGRTLPMLPRSLTAKISLNPEQKTAAHSVFFTIEKKTGKILEVERCHTWVKITHSLTYDEVQNLIEGRPHPRWNANTVKHLNAMVELGAVLRQTRKAKEQFITLEIPEVRVIVDEKAGVVQGVVHKEQKEAEHIVEECMLLANSAVAEEMLADSTPSLYRVHNELDPEKVEQFVSFLYESYGIHAPLFQSRVDCNRFLDALPRDEKFPTIMNAFLRAMARANYSAECTPHFGLGKEHYLHFTSPIRRYTDLAVHRQLTAKTLKKNIASNATMESLAQWCTEQEMNVDEAYYAANDRMKLHYLWKVSSEDTDKTWIGVVNRMTARGVSVEIHELSLFGFIEADTLAMQKRRFEHGLRKKPRRKKNAPYFPVVDVGEHLPLYVEHIDFTRGCACFRIALDEG